MLVCGFSGLSVEYLKEFRADLKKLGFQCKITSGNLCISEMDGTRSDWDLLLKKLLKNKKIVPFFYKVEKNGEVRYVGIEYFKESIKVNNFEVINMTIVKPLVRTLSNLIWLRSLSLLKSRK